jgi:hypothetical protein
LLNDFSIGLFANITPTSISIYCCYGLFNYIDLSNYILKYIYDIFKANSCSYFDQVMVNIDGASKEHGKPSCGGIVRGNNGEWLGDFAKFLGDYSPIVVNLEFEIPECVTKDLLYKQTKV